MNKNIYAKTSLKVLAKFTAPIILLAVAVNFLLAGCPPPPGASCMSCSFVLELCSVSSQYTSSGSTPIKAYYTSIPHGTNDQMANWFLGGSGSFGGGYTGENNNMTGITTSNNILKSWPVDCQDANNTSAIVSLVNIYTVNPKCSSGEEEWQLSNGRIGDYDFGPNHCNSVVCLNSLSKKPVVWL